MLESTASDVLDETRFLPLEACEVSFELQHQPEIVSHSCEPDDADGVEALDGLGQFVDDEALTELDHRFGPAIIEEWESLTVTATWAGADGHTYTGTAVASRVTLTDQTAEACATELGLYESALADLNAEIRAVIVRGEVLVRQREASQTGSQ